MKKLFTDIFKIKMEASIRLMQMHINTVIRSMGPDIAYTVQNQLYTDMLSVLWKTRDDDQVRHTEPFDERWAQFKVIMTDEFNTMNHQIESLLEQKLSDLVKVGRYDHIVFTTCDRIVDILNAELSMIGNKEA
jgi:hypothetical protein